MEGNHLGNRLATAQAAMKDRDFTRAIALFEAHLADHPRDLTPLLQLGICHLLTDSVEAFGAIYQTARSLVQELGQLPGDVHALWSRYGTLAKKTGATALIAGTVVTAAAASGCGKPHSAHKYSAGVYHEPVVMKAQPDVKTDPVDKPDPDMKPAVMEPPMTEEPIVRPPHSAHRYSAGVYLPPSVKPEGTMTPEMAPPKKPPMRTSQHRYSGGIYRGRD